MGRLIFESITARDYPMILGIFLVVSMMIVLANLITDILYAMIDPRGGLWIGTWNRDDNNKANPSPKLEKRAAVEGHLGSIQPESSGAHRSVRVVVAGFTGFIRARPGAL